MCYGGHIVLDDYRVFTLVDGAVLEIKNGHIFKQIANSPKPQNPKIFQRIFFFIVEKWTK
jgi:hypothetical protein